MVQRRHIKNVNKHADADVLQSQNMFVEAHVGIINRSGFAYEWVA